MKAFINHTKAQSGKKPIGCGQVLTDLAASLHGRWRLVT